MIGLKVKVVFKLKVENQDVQFKKYKNNELSLPAVSSRAQIQSCDSYHVEHQTEEIEKEVIITASKIRLKRNPKDSTITVTWKSGGVLPVIDYVGKEKFLKKLNECCKELSEVVLVRGNKSAIQYFQMLFYSNLNALYQEFMNSPIIQIANLDFQFTNYFEVCCGSVHEKPVTTIFENIENLVYLD